MKAVLRLGSLELHSLAMLAPMAGVCDSPFKRVVRRFDPFSLLSSEIVNCDALLAGDAGMRRRLRLHPEESPAALQLSGHEPGPLARAAELAQEAGADLIDLNCGCPSPQLVKSGNGAALLRDPSRLAELFSAVRAVTRVPMSVKLRLGWQDARTGLEVARLAQECGADAVWVHGRTAAQGYGGTADWDAIGAIKRALRIPVIGNGDVFTPQGAAERRTLSGADAIAVGRGAMGNPWIFRRVDRYLQTGELLPEPTLAERLAALWLQCELLIADQGDEQGVRACRKHVAWYVRGLPEAGSLQREANAAAGPAALFGALAGFLDRSDPQARPDPQLVGALVDPKWQRFRPAAAGYNATSAPEEDS